MSFSVTKCLRIVCIYYPKYTTYLDDQIGQNILDIIGKSYITIKKRNHEFSNSPIHEFKVLQNVFKMKKQGLECFLK